MPIWEDKEIELAHQLRSSGKSFTEIAAMVSSPQATRTAKAVETILYRRRKQTRPTTPTQDRVLLQAKDELADLTKKYKTVQRDITFQDRVITTLKESSCRLKPIAPLRFPVRKDVKLVVETVGLLLSDWHCGETVDAQQTGGLGGYNMDIMIQELQYLADEVIDISQQKMLGYKLKKLVVFMLGDIASSNIHELLASSDYTCIDSFLHAGFLFSQFLLDMTTVFDQIEVVCVVGNHGRLSQKKKYKERYVNFDYAMYNQMSFMLVGIPQIRFFIPQSFWTLHKVMGWDFLALHGDDVHSWNQIPWYGILRALRKFQELLDMQDLRYDYATLGHFHNAGTLDRCRGEILLNGSAIGPTDFSIGKLFTGSRPTQQMFGIHKEHGITWRFPLRLDNIDSSMSLRYRLDRTKQLNHQLRDVLKSR